MVSVLKELAQPRGETQICILQKVAQWERLCEPEVAKGWRWLDAGNMKQLKAEAKAKTDASKAAKRALVRSLALSGALLG